MAASERNDGRRKKKRIQLSDLRDEILIRIISLLPTRDSVATSLLSSRWLYLWTSITKLEFSGDNFYGDRMWSRFMNFVDNIMIRRDHRSSLASFHFKCSNVLRDDLSRVNTWIISAIRCNVKDLSLHLLNNNNVNGSSSSYWLPLCVFSCQSLVRLDLNMRPFILTIPSRNRICLPNLKYLKLERARLDNDESTEQLLSNPLLEELDIRCCIWGGTRSFSVPAPNLRVLTLDENIWNEDRVPVDDVIYRKLGFSGDNLDYFSFKGLPCIEICIRGSAMQLKKAEISAGNLNRYPVYKKNKDIMAKRLYKLLSSLSWARELTLTKEFLKILKWTPKLVDTIPVFDCLTQLNLDAYSSDKVRVDGWMIMEIYKRCPHLEHLNVMKMMNKCVKGRLPDSAPPCFRTHLKRITLVKYRPTKKQDNALQVLLSSAPILDKMIIFCKNSTTKKNLELKLNRGGLHKSV